MARSVISDTVSSHGRAKASHSRAKAGGRLAAAVAAAVVVGQIATVAHLASVRHATCAEHGETVHVGAATSAPWHAGPPTGPVATRARDEASPHADDHCLSLFQRHGRAQLQPDAGHPLVIARTTPLAAPHATDARFPGEPLYRLAPKISPPV